MPIFINSSIYFHLNYLKQIYLKQKNNINYYGTKRTKR